MKNHTTTATKHQTIAKIEKLLINQGATAVQKIIAGKEVVGLLFELAEGGRPIWYKEQPDVESMYKLLTAKGKPKTETTRKQAERTAWKNLLDMYEMMFMQIEAGQYAFFEQNMGKAYNGQTRATMYEILQQNDFQTPLLP